MNQNKIPLSASRIKTLDSCSWEYYCNYVLKLPDQTNSGAVMGSCCHNLYEYLGEEKRKKIFDKLVKHQNVSCCPQVERYINSFLKKEGFPPKGLAKSAHGEEISHFDLVERMFLEGRGTSGIPQYILNLFDNSRTIGVHPYYLCVRRQFA